MLKDNHKLSRFVNILKPINIGIIIGFVCGLSVATIHDLNTDPFEKKNMFEAEQEGLDNIRWGLISKLAGIKQEKAEAQKEIVLNEKDIQDLKTLGYIQ